MARLAFDLSILRVLLVEDDTFSRELEKTAFQHLGVKSIAFAKDQGEAIDTLQRGLDCDLIAFDWNMPMLDARSMVQTVRESWPGISILMLTNNEGLNQIKLAREAGVDGCLIKPFSLDKLREVVQLVLVAKLTGREDRTTPSQVNVTPELEAIVASVRDVINQTSGPRSNKAMTALEMQNVQAFAAGLLKQFSNFVTAAHSTDQAALDVINLHVDCLLAVLGGRGDLFDHETRNIIVDGLALASDMVKP